MKRRSKIASSKSIAQIFPAYLSGSGLPVIVFFAAIGMIVFSSMNPQATEAIRTKAVDSFAPVLSVVTTPVQNAATVLRDISGLATMQSENQRLMAENERLREWYQTALLLQAENKSFRELLNLKEEAAKTFITARVMSDAGNAFANTLLLAAGKSDGLKKGQAVMSGQGVIGRVIEVGDKASRILLITDINSRVPVLIEDTSQHSILAGDNKTAAKLMHLPPESRVNDGARIITSGYGGIFPPGLPVGIAHNDEKRGIIVKPLSDMNKITFVRIIEHVADPYLREGVLLGN